MLSNSARSSILQVSYLVLFTSQALKSYPEVQVSAYRASPDWWLGVPRRDVPHLILQCSEADVLQIQLIYYTGRSTTSLGLDKVG